jgi:hypothetical protein
MVSGGGLLPHHDPNWDRLFRKECDRELAQYVSHVKPIRKNSAGRAQWWTMLNHTLEDMVALCRPYKDQLWWPPTMSQSSSRSCSSPLLVPKMEPHKKPRTWPQNKKRVATVGCHHWVDAGEGCAPHPPRRPWNAYDHASIYMSHAEAQPPYWLRDDPTDTSGFALAQRESMIEADVNALSYDKRVDPIFRIWFRSKFLNYNIYLNEIHWFNLYSCLFLK